MVGAVGLWLPPVVYIYIYIYIAGVMIKMRNEMGSAGSDLGLSSHTALVVSVVSGHLCPSSMRLKRLASPWDAMKGHSLSSGAFMLSNDGADVALACAAIVMSVCPSSGGSVRLSFWSIEVGDAKEIANCARLVWASLVKHWIPSFSEAFVNIIWFCCGSLGSMVHKGKRCRLFALERGIGGKVCMGCGESVLVGLHSFFAVYFFSEVL